MKKPYHIVTRAGRESAAVIEQFCRANGQILLPILNLIENASQVVETVRNPRDRTPNSGTDPGPERRASGRPTHAGQGQR